MLEITKYINHKFWRGYTGINSVNQYVQWFDAIIVAGWNRFTDDPHPQDKRLKASKVLYENGKLVPGAYDDAGKIFHVFDENS